MNSPKTTILGVLTIACALLQAAKSYLSSGVVSDIPGLIAALSAGFGLIKAADAKGAAQ